MRMIRTIVHMHITYYAATETVLRQHTFHHLDKQGVITGLDALVKRLLEKHLRCGNALPARIAGVRKILAVGHFFTCEHDFVGIDNDYIVTALHERRIARFVLATKNFGNFCAQTAKNLVGGIYHHPFALNALSVWG